MSSHPKITYVFTNLFIFKMECQGGLMPKFKILIGYVTIFSSRCLYCQALTILGAEHFGVAKTRLEGVWDYSKSTGFSNAEKATLGLAFANECSHNKVTETTISRLKSFWKESDIIGTIGVILLFDFFDRWNENMESALADFPIEKSEKYLKKPTNQIAGKHRF